MKKLFTYKIVGAGVDLDGWYKTYLIRNDGREVKVNRKRLAELRRARRITE